MKETNFDKIVDLIIWIVPLIILFFIDWTWMIIYATIFIIVILLRIFQKKKTN